MIGHGREIGVEPLLEGLSRALSADHAQQILRGAKRGIGRQRRQSLGPVEHRRQEHRQRAADQEVMRQRIGVGQHAQPHPKRLDRRQPLACREQLWDIPEGPDPGRGKALGHSRLIAAAGGVVRPEQGRDPLEAAGRHQLRQSMAADHQPALLAVDFAHDRVGHDDSVEPAIHPCLQHFRPLGCSRGKSGCRNILSILIALINI